MTASSWRVVTMCVVAVTAYVIMLSTYTVTPGQLSTDYVGAVLLVPMAAYCLAGLLVRSQPVVFAILLMGVVALSGVTVLVHLGNRPFGLVADGVWTLQLAAGGAAILVGIATYGGLSAFVGFVVGAVLG